jgi:colanic acid biosynthesis glycosyl transferase WcaI
MVTVQLPIYNERHVVARLLNAVALRVRGTPFVCVVKDLYPESMQLTDAKGARRLARWVLRVLDGFVYRLSAGVTTLTSRQAEVIVRNRGVAPEKVVCVPDWSSGIGPDPEGSTRFRAEHGIGAEKFVAAFVGSLAGTAGLEVLLDCASILGPNDEIEIVVVGDGAGREELAAGIEGRGLENIRVITPLEPDDVPAVQSAADVLLVSLRPDAASLTLPSKLIAYLPSARPVVASVDRDSAAADLVRESGCGVVTPAGDGAALAEALERLAVDPQQCRAFGAAARTAAEQFRPERALPVVCDLLEDVSR